MTLQLNYDALMQLIGKDTETHIAVQRAVAEEICKKKIKCFINDHTVQKLHAEWEALWKAEIDLQIRQFAADKQNLNPAGASAWSLRDAMEKVANKILEPVLLEKVTAYLGSTADRLIRLEFNKITEMLAAVVKHEIKVQVEAAVAHEVQYQTGALMETLVEAEVHRRLAIAKSLGTKADPVIIEYSDPQDPQGPKDPKEPR